MVRNVLIKLFFLPLILFGQNNHELSDYDVYKNFMPSSTDSVIVHHNHYSYSYSKKFKLTEWTIYFSTKERLTGKQFPRTTNFKDDPKLKDEIVSGNASKDDYSYSGYDRGHLVPARDMAFSKKALSESFYYSNMNPQLPGFNRSVNKNVEDLIRKWIIEKDSLVIITGNVYKDRKDYGVEEATFGRSQIPVPAFFYKIIIDINEKSSLALLLPHFDSLYKNWIEYVCSISTLENLTATDFFYKLPKDLELDFEDKHSLND